MELIRITRNALLALKDEMDAKRVRGTHRQLVTELLARLPTIEKEMNP